MDSWNLQPESSKDKDFDYFQQTQHNTEEQLLELCCCEYINKNNERSHILACCCNCEDFDILFSRLVFCRGVGKLHFRNMLLTFQDRLRIPWRDGAIQVSLDMLAPIIAIPIIIAIAAINIFTAVIMFLSSLAFLCYAYSFVKRTLPRSKFFFMWAFWSVVYLIILFELTVPLLELLPEENLLLVTLVAISVFCLWKTKNNAVLNHVVQSTVDEDELPDITEADEEHEQTSLLLEPGGTNDDSDDERHHPTICQVCRKYVQPRTCHCTVCQACIMKRDHHSYWLACCIGGSNHRYYLLGLLFAEFALLLIAYLTLTAVCHPFLILRLFNRIPLMLPDDCSDVFDDYEVGIAFIIAVYALTMAAYILFILLTQCYLISKGTTMSECRRGQSGNRKTILHNWKTFIC